MAIDFLKFFQIILYSLVLACPAVFATTTNAQYLDALRGQKKQLLKEKRSLKARLAARRLEREQLKVEGFIDRFGGSGVGAALAASAMFAVLATPWNQKKCKDTMSELGIPVIGSSFAVGLVAFVSPNIAFNPEEMNRELKDIIAQDIKRFVKRLEEVEESLGRTERLILHIMELEN